MPYSVDTDPQFQPITPPLCWYAIRVLMDSVWSVAFAKGVDSVLVERQIVKTPIVKAVPKEPGITKRKLITLRASAMAMEEKDGLLVKPSTAFVALYDQLIESCQ